MTRPPIENPRFDNTLFARAMDFAHVVHLKGFRRDKTPWSEFNPWEKLTHSNASLCSSLKHRVERTWSTSVRYDACVMTLQPMRVGGQHTSSSVKCRASSSATATKSLLNSLGMWRPKRATASQARSTATPSMWTRLCNIACTDRAYHVHAGLSAV